MPAPPPWACKYSLYYSGIRETFPILETGSFSGSGIFNKKSGKPFPEKHRLRHDLYLSDQELIRQLHLLASASEQALIAGHKEGKKENSTNDGKYRRFT